MNICCKMILVGPAALLLSACGADTESADTGADREVAVQVEPAPSEPAAAPSSEPATDKATTPDSDEPAPAQVGGAEANADADAAAADGEGEGDPEEYSTDVLTTPSDAITFWVKSMAKGDVYGSLFASDTGSSAYSELLKHAETVEEVSLSDDPQQRVVLDVLRIVFNDPWKDAEIRLVAEQPPRAQFDVEWTNGRVITIDLNQVEDLWRVLVTKEMLQPDTGAIDENDIPTPPPPANP